MLKRQERVHKLFVWWKTLLKSTASVFDIGGTSFHKPQILSDEDAVKRDWEVVGDDLRTAIETFHRENAHD